MVGRDLIRFHEAAVEFRGADTSTAAREIGGARRLV